jgi:hypothetical protein
MKARSLSLWATLAFSCLTFVPTLSPALASPWAEVGDNQLRSDIELLAAAGVVQDVTSHWPMPWRSLVAALHRANWSGQPASVRAAAERVLQLAKAQTRPGLSSSATADATNLPSVVYGFDGLSRGKGEGQVSLSVHKGIFSGRLSLGAFVQDYRPNGVKLMPDGSYVAARLGGALVYAGYLDHWWGPGQISALSLSNNARPMPQIGIERSSTAASTWPVLNLLGPWQVEFLLGYMDGPRIQRDTYFSALRFTFNPLPGLEIGLSRTEQFCGHGHACAPLRDYFNLQNDPSHVNNTNDEGDIDIKYSEVLAGVPTQFYMQLMNEDSSPFTRSGTSHLFGASIFLPVANNPLKVTVEYSDSIATQDIFSFGNRFYGFSYNNGGYPDGMRYRGRTLGFSLDNDSTVASLQGSWTDPGGRFYELSLHHATISSSHSPGANVLSPLPVRLNLAEARVSIPIMMGGGHLKLDLAGRLQDDQPRPRQGFAAAIESAIRIAL